MSRVGRQKTGTVPEMTGYTNCLATAERVKGPIPVKLLNYLWSCVNALTSGLATGVSTCEAKLPGNVPP